MDVSQEYIKMCEKATEIQSMFSKVQLGAWALRQDYIVGEDDRVFVNGIWLPRQDQLQEMLGDYKYCLKTIWEAVEDGGTGWKEWAYCQSMEQLWLACVMWEKYNKIWNGEDWTTHT